jgi:hypothetical protein
MDLLSFVFERVSNLCFTNVEDNEGQAIMRIAQGAEEDDVQEEEEVVELPVTLDEVCSYCYSSRADAEDAIDKVGRAEGFAMVLKTRKTEKYKNGGTYERVVLRCDMNGEHKALKIKRSYLREPATQKAGCPFEGCNFSH